MKFVGEWLLGLSGVILTFLLPSTFFSYQGVWLGTLWLGVLWAVFIVLSIAGVSLVLRKRSAAETSLSTGPTVSNGDAYVNNGDNSGHMGPVNNYGKQPLVFSEAEANKLIALLDIGKPIEFWAVGSATDQAVAMQFKQALLAAGCQIPQVNTVGMMGPPPSQPITVNEGSGVTTVTIAPNA
jgi:hypothetical protein